MDEGFFLFLYNLLIMPILEVRRRHAVYLCISLVLKYKTSGDVGFAVGTFLVSWEKANLWRE